MERVRAFLQGNGGWAVGIILLLAGGVAVVYSITANARPDPTAQDMWVDMGVNPPKPFPFTLKAGVTIPTMAPSGGKTGYPAERCYWTADGKIKDTPTYVVMNNLLGIDGPTFCPDCGRLVVGHNPQPSPGSRPPPTREEYMATHPGN